MQVTELHQNLTLWLVNLLRHMTADRLSWECPQWQESDTEMDKELRLLGARKLQHGAEELIAEMGRLSGSIFRYQQRFLTSSKEIFSRKKMCSVLRDRSWQQIPSIWLSLDLFPGPKWDLLEFVGSLIR